MSDSPASKCRCNSCCPDDPDPRATEAYRHECEVRFVYSMKANYLRRDYLEGVAKHRGDAAAQRLRKDAWALMRSAQSV